MGKQRVALYFGSFNPIHNGHIAIAEHVVDQGLCDMLVMIVSPQNPLKQATDLAPDLARFEMVEAACASSKHPVRIVPSAIEFVLPRPSYTIDTLRALEQERGDDMEFSVIMGGDLAEQLPRWKEWQTLLQNYPIYMYPREGVTSTPYPEITMLEGAPELPFSSTDVRERLKRGESIDDMVPAAVAKYIADNGLWKKQD
ncbi:MAG: nicotinate (nicotinamide) nucleotide adenylyltransferase [Rikenellaceae bacterium]|nr:nicotinate (nicotinamide) nucleotide adenylyltransferase [Rikenellaceae bacterium]